MAKDDETYPAEQDRKRTQPQIIPSAMDEMVNEKIEPRRNNGTSNKWIMMTYYEFFDRVGSFEGCLPLIAIDGFCDSGAPDRFCLGAFGTANRTAKVVQVRRQIGCGCHVRKDNNRVLVTNQADASIFVQCPMQSEANGLPPETVTRLRKSQELVVFDTDDFLRCLQKRLKTRKRSDLYEFANITKVRISFGKGFGDGFNREKITEVPCWVEVSFVDVMKDVDKEIMLLDQASGNINSFT